MANKKATVTVDQALFDELSVLIEQSRQQITIQANSTLTMLFWHVGERINREILHNKRAGYGELIVVTLSRQLSWSHILTILPLKNNEAKLFYARRVADQGWGVRELRKRITQKEFERTSIANLQNSSGHSEMHDTFKDPYFLDFLGLQNTWLEQDLEQAILRELEAFILELYLKWLNRYERKEGELAPVGLILCAESSREQVELLEMHKDGIMVAEYWTELPPKKELEQKIHNILIEARERLDRKKLSN